MAVIFLTCRNIRYFHVNTKGHFCPRKYGIIQEVFLRSIRYTFSIKKGQAALISAGAESLAHRGGFDKKERNGSNESIRIIIWKEKRKL